MSEAILRLKSLEQTFRTKSGAVPAVGGIDVDVVPGKVVCLVGESGCGKTTTARAAAGLTKPTGGSVEYLGRDIHSLSKRDFRRFRLDVQYIHQDPYAALNPIRTVVSTLTAAVRKHRVVTTQRQARQKARELLELVDLTPPETYLDKYPHQMSGGQRQRVNVARSLALDPKVLIADESTSMLDVSIRVSMLNTLGKLRDELGVGFLFITHDLAVAKYFAWDGEIAVMYLGKVVEQAPTPEVINNPQHPYTKALIDAVCEPDPRLAKSGDKSGGLRSAEIPNLTDLPSGCTFHPRCPLFESGTCDTMTPSLTEIEESRRLACTVVSRNHTAALEKVET
ncbi:ABC transporter ATP-binding protein [Haloglycomyces albus]|uniref:ABC transporter ATP-binding protein n=1 Tax=Haloglycomyces albus TaxID=526067 RepID=UPI0004A3EAD7|nr:ABC transporter ATP-binding protein [Haloglycomyces albus]